MTTQARTHVQSHFALNRQKALLICKMHLHTYIMYLFILKNELHPLHSTLLSSQVESLPPLHRCYAASAPFLCHTCIELYCLVTIMLPQVAAAFNGFKPPQMEIDYTVAESCNGEKFVQQLTCHL